MPSPFPGMDPYLEAPEGWSGFQIDVAGESAAALNRLIQPAYYADLTSHEELGLLHVEVRTTDARKLVAWIEVLSPVSKHLGSEECEQYLLKRRELLRGPVHLLEIDLLRAGTRPPLEQPVPGAPYYAVLSRGTHRPHVEVWPIRLWERLPVLPVPLLAPDPDTVLDLGAVVASVYERGAYGIRIDYSQPPPPPPLTDEESDYLEKRLREQGLRPS